MCYPKFPLAPSVSDILPQGEIEDEDASDTESDTTSDSDDEYDEYEEMDRMYGIYDGDDGYMEDVNEHLYVDDPFENFNSVNYESDYPTSDSDSE